MSVVESHPRLLTYYLTALDPHQFDAWADDVDPGILRDLALTFLNFPDHDLDAASPDRAVSIAGRLADLLAPPLQARAQRCARLAGTDFRSGDTDVDHALTFAHHAPELLHDTPLLTRIVAAAQNLASDATDVESCAAMLQLSADALNTGVIPDEEHETPAPETDLAELNRQLALINFKASLNQAASPPIALASLARLIYDSTAVSIFLQQEQGWSNGELVLTSGRSMVEKAAASGQAVTSANRTLTAVDEKLVTELGTRYLVAVPICLSTSADSCAAVAAVGVEDENPADHPTALFQDVAQHILSNPAVPSINRDDIVQRARELIHEANNPLSTVQNYLKILSLKLGAEHDAQSTLDSISTELYRTADIIEQFRHLDQQPEAVDEATDVNSIIEQQAALFGKSAGNLEFRLKLDNARPLASIQNAALKQVIVNLFKNAVEAMAGGGEITVESRGGLRQGTGSWVEISVTDTGHGIDNSLGDIFQPGTTSRAGDHRGQGLGVATKLIEAAGGYLSYRSNPGATEFRLTLPQTEELEQ